jgi:hypothetical protein
MEVHPSFPAKSVSEFIAYVKANPGPFCLPAKLWHHDAHAVPLNAIQRCPKSQGLLVEDGVTLPVQINGRNFDKTDACRRAA